MVIAAATHNNLKIRETITMNRLMSLTITLFLDAVHDGVYGAWFLIQDRV